MSGKDYRVYIANLHAVGCPEATIEDIVRGDTERAFAWERNQLSLDGYRPRSLVAGAGSATRGQPVERSVIN